MQEASKCRDPNLVSSGSSRSGEKYYLAARAATTPTAIPGGGTAQWRENQLSTIVVSRLKTGRKPKIAMFSRPIDDEITSKSKLYKVRQ